MFYVKKSIRPVFTVLLTILPIAFSILASVKTSLLFLALAIVCLFLAVWLLPYVKGHESIWMFILSGVCLIPINIKTITLLLSSFVFEDDTFVLQLLKGLLLIFILFSTEEIILGTITRLIWKRQNKTIA